MQHTTKVACKRGEAVPSIADQVSVQSTGREDDRHIMSKERLLDGGRLVA